MIAQENTTEETSSTSTEPASTETLVSTDATPEPAPELDQEIQAAQYLQRAIPRFRNDLHSVTGIQAKRVLSALIESPMEQETAKFTTQGAYNLFESGSVITNAKFILFTASLLDHLSTALNAKFNLGLSFKDLKTMISESQKVVSELQQAAVAAQPAALQVEETATQGVENVSETL